MANYISALGLAKEMQDQAQLDPLTGLANRRALEETYHGLQDSHEHQRSGDLRLTEETAKHSLILLDLDHFKAINDTLGHGEGDRVLREVGSVISERVRKRDLAARIGGEEFALLLPRTTPEQAMKVAEQLRQRTEEGGSVTLSAGVGGIDLSTTLEKNLARVDRALYGAKERGRNQVAQYGWNPVPH